jgi:hypothetical protein
LATAFTEIGPLLSFPYAAPYSSKAGGYGLYPTLVFLGVQKLNGSEKKEKTRAKSLLG